MNITASGSYKKSNKNGGVSTVFRYIVKGTPEDLTKYTEAQGNFYRENDEKQPLFFSNRFVGNTGKLLITAQGKVAVDSSEMDQLSSLINQHPGALGDALAKAGAEMLLGHKPQVQPAKVDEKIGNE